MSAQAQPRLTPEQYLDAERTAEFRHEYYNGQIYAMSGGSYRDGQIIGNLTVESLQEYALVSQAEPRVEVFRRQCGGHWLLSEAVGLEAVCHFESLDCAVPLAEIYAKVTFSPDDPLASIRPAS
jgi:Uma2 family endonuclease